MQNINSFLKKLRSCLTIVWDVILKWYVIIPLTFIIFFFWQNIQNYLFPCFNLIYIENVNELIKEHTQNIIALVGITFMVIGFLMNRFVENDSYVRDLLLKKSRFPSIAFFVLTLIFCFVLLTSIKSSNINIVNEVFLLRTVVNGTYLFLIAIFGIGLLFHQLIQFSKEENVIKFVKKELMNDKSSNTKKYIIQKLNKCVKADEEKSVEAYLDMILEMYKKIQQQPKKDFQNRKDENITSGIYIEITDLIDNAIKFNAEKSFNKINEFCSQILSLAIKNKHLPSFREYLSVVLSYYTQAYKYNQKNNAIYSEIFNVCSQKTAIIIKTRLLYLNTLCEKTDIVEKKELNEFKYIAFSSFNDLLFWQVAYRDITNFKNALNELEQCFMGAKTNISYFIFTLRNLEKSDLQKSKECREDFEGVFYFRHILLGIKYWLYFLYENKIITKEKLNDFLTPIKQSIQRKQVDPSFEELKLLFKKLITQQNYFNWQNWDYEKHPDGKVYVMKEPLNWIFKGYIIDVIEKGHFSHINYELEQLEFYEESFIERLEYEFINIKEKPIWKNYLNNEKNFHNIEEEIKNLVNESLNLEKIKEFKNKFYNEWVKSKFIRNIFEIFNAKQKSEKEIEPIGESHFYEKILFIGNDNDLNHIRFEQISLQGATLSGLENELFYETIIKQGKEIIYNSVIEGLDESINKIRGKGKKPSVIFISRTLGFLYLKGNEKWNNEKKFDFSDGSYDSISVFFIDAYLENKFIIADFEKAFTMFSKEFPDGYEINKELKIEVRELPNEEVNPVNIEFCVAETFDIIDTNAFEIGLIKNITYPNCKCEYDKPLTPI